ncbi:MAG: FeoA family protein [Anaerovoracaceae bacterium]|mgnify:CR=1 FL=1|jgi:ferrous iron transport protein A
MMTLKDCRRGNVYIVEKSMLKQPGKRRLESLGLTEGTLISKLNEAIDGSIIFLVRGSRLAIGKDLADDIIVRDMTESDIRGKKNGWGKRRRNRHGKGGI